MMTADMHPWLSCLGCLVFVRRPGNSSLATTPRRLRLAVPGCVPEHPRTPGKLVLPLLCAPTAPLETQTQGQRCSSPGNAAGHRARVTGQTCACVCRGRCQWLSTHCCATRLSQLPGRQGRTGALRRRNWLPRWCHARRSGRYPDASGGPSPCHLSETGALGTSAGIFACLGSASAESALRKPRPSSHRGKRNTFNRGLPPSLCGLYDMSHMHLCPFPSPVAFPPSTTDTCTERTLVRLGAV